MLSIIECGVHKMLEDFLRFIHFTSSVSKQLYQGSYPMKLSPRHLSNSVQKRNSACLKLQSCRQTKKKQVAPTHQAHRR